MKNVKKIKINRIEEHTVIAFLDSGDMLTFPSNIADLHENDICNAVFDDLGNIISVTVLPEETFKEKQRLRSKLRKLFKK